MTTKAPKVAFQSLGCRVNRVETDVIAGELRSLGFELSSERDAQAIVINTCAVTGEAEAKTRKAIRHAASLPQHPVVVATGCVATLFYSELSDLADNVVVEVDKSHVARRVMDELELDGTSLVSGARFDTPTATGRTRPGIKVQDGCDLRCTYCIVWKARGASRSVSPSDVISQVRAACDAGAREVVLTGINLGRYRSADDDGHDLLLPGLIDLLLSKTDVGRIRLGSIEPQDVDRDLVRLMAESCGRVAPFLHMCLQSGCDATLRRMGRVYDSSLFRERLELVREHVPNAAFGTDLIVGFPQESDAEFEESRAFCEEARFSHIHAFRYSRRPGTPAAEMEGQVDPMVAARRAAQVGELSRRMRVENARSLQGTSDLVVVQSPGRGVSGGLFDVILDPEVAVGELVPVHVTGVTDDATLVCDVTS